jgi:hypothetical protein
MTLQYAEYVAEINPPTANANAVILGAKLTRIKLGELVWEAWRRN